MGKPKVRTLRRSVPPTPQSRNRILAALPRVDFERLRSALSVVTLEQKHSLWEPGQPIEVVYFPLDFVASIPGQGERLDVSVFLREALREGKLRDILHRYTLSFMTQVSQSFACNRAHPAPQRLARWLLVVRDRVGRNEFPLTHQFMGQMLAVRRATVTETAGALQRARLISYRRGVITIRDGPGLERIACECYWIVREEFERLLGSPTR
jgi:hypothetical protein